MTTWATDLATVGPIYPFTGFEVPMLILGVIFWIGFHVWQMSVESRVYEEDLAKLRKPEDIIAALEKGKID